MDAGLSSLRSEAVGAMRTALVSAENLQLTLKTELSQEEQALTNAKISPKETHKAGYCSKLPHSTVMETYRKLNVFCFFDISCSSGYCSLSMLLSWMLNFQQKSFKRKFLSFKMRCNKL